MGSRFSGLADEFIAKVRSARIEPSTEVWLTFHCVGADGHDVPPIRTALEPSTKVEWPGGNDLACQLTASVHRDTICRNIDSLVRHAPEGLVMLRDGPQHPVAIRDFSLEIVQTGRLTDLSEIQSRLHRELPALAERYGVRSLGLFGSYVRRENRPDSDLDVLVAFDEVPSLLKFIELENYLSDLLGIEVDLVLKDALKPRIGRRVLEEVVPI